MNQVKKNFVTNIFVFCVNIAVGLLYTPFLVKMLGTEAYGIVPLALIINQYISILTDSLRGAVTRFYSVEYRQGNYNKASAYFTSSIVLSIALALILIPLSCIPIHYSESLLHIPHEYVSSAKLLFLLTVISLFISVISNCVNITIFADNRLDYMNYLKIIRNVSKLLINVFLFIFISVDISGIGIANICSEVLVLIVSVYFFKQKKPRGIYFSFSIFHMKDVSPIFGMITWVSITSLASVFIYRIDALFINNYFGLYNTGILGAISEFGSYCNSITAILSSLLSPLILIAYSKLQHEDVVSLTVRGGYVIGLFCSLICGLIMGFSFPVLNLWLNEDFAHHSFWMIIKISTIALTTMGSVYAYANYCCNIVKKPALYSLIISIVYVLLSIILLELGMKIEGFLIINCVASIAQAVIMSQVFFMKSYPSARKIIHIKNIKLVLYLVIVFSISWFFCKFVEIHNLFQLLLYLLLFALVSSVLALSFMNKHDIQTLNLFVPVKTLIRYIPIIKNKE